MEDNIYSAIWICSNTFIRDTERVKLFNGIQGPLLPSSPLPCKGSLTLLIRNIYCPCVMELVAAAHVRLSSLRHAARIVCPLRLCGHRSQLSIHHQEACIGIRIDEYWGLYMVLKQIYFSMSHPAETLGHMLQPTKIPSSVKPDAFTSRNEAAHSHLGLCRQSHGWPMLHPISRVLTLTAGTC